MAVYSEFLLTGELIIPNPTPRAITISINLSQPGISKPIHVLNTKKIRAAIVDQTTGDLYHS